MACARRKDAPCRCFGTDGVARGRNNGVGFNGVGLGVAEFFGALVFVSPKVLGVTGASRSVALMGAFKGEGAGASERHVMANSNAR